MPACSVTLGSRTQQLTVPWSFQTLPEILYAFMVICKLWCQLMSSPAECSLVLPLCRPVLDVDTLPGVSACGLNMPSPDLLTPERSAATIWTWAPGHPQANQSAQEAASSFWSGAKRLLWRLLSLSMAASNAQVQVLLSWVR